MAKVLNTSRAYAEIEDITCKAKKGLVLISPYIKFPETFLERLKDVDKNNIKITIVCREEDLKPEVMSDLRKLNSLELRFLKNLHAKCFYNETSMVITSLNLYEFSQQNNREMGVLVNIQDDRDIYLEALNEANFIIRSATVFKSSRIKDALEFGTSLMKDVDKLLHKDLGEIFNNSNSEVKTKGYCVRCCAAIPLNVDKPYCQSCYTKWKEWENAEYKEEHCHICGKREATSKNKPQCHSCYKSLKSK